MTKPKPKGTLRKTGRPAKYKPEFDALARNYCLLGATNEQIAKCFQVSLSTVDKWIAEIPSFSSALKEGRQDADARVAQSLFHRATGYSHPEVHISNYQGEITITPITKHYPPDPVSMIFWLKNRRPDLWRAQPEDGGEAPQPVKVVFEVKDASIPEPG